MWHIIRITTVCALLEAATAHLMLSTPRQFDDKLENIPHRYEPLNFTGTTQFPCKNGPDYNYDFSQSTTVPAGQSTYVSFECAGDPKDPICSVHGGGSCQFAISSNPTSTNYDDWKVIRSVIGGCPASATGNLPWNTTCSTPDSDETECVKSYNVQIPKEVPAGNYAFAWVWFNRLGNREFYMSCAPITVTNDAGDPAYLKTLPGVFKANFRNDECRFEHGYSPPLPNPGPNYRVSPLAIDRVAIEGLGNCTGRGDPTLFGEQGNNGDGAAGIIPAPPANTAAPPFPNTTVAPAGGEPTPTSTTTIVVYVTATAAAGIAPPGVAAPSGSSSGFCAAGHIPCPQGTADGAMACVSGLQFGICDRGCLVPQDVAPGTLCQDGQIVAVAAKGKRHEGEEELLNLGAHEPRFVGH